MDELSIRRYIRELNKTYCSLDPINVSKITVAFEAAAPFIASLVNKYFEECIFFEKVALLRPLLKGGVTLGNFFPAPSKMRANSPASSYFAVELCSPVGRRAAADLGSQHKFCKQQRWPPSMQIHVLQTLLIYLYRIHCF